MILFENDACLVINKLVGQSSEFPGVKTNSAGEGYPAPVHRLDLPVSGCLLLARTQAAAAFLGAAFSRPGEVRKRYWAITELPGRAASGAESSEQSLIPASGELVHWLSFDREKNKSFAHTEGGHGRKKAILRYRTVGKGDRYLFLEVELVTGRHHQIRSQLAALGFHVKGDLKYGARRSEKNGGIRLHAYSLAFPNPLAPTEAIEVTAAPPEMDALWKAFAEAYQTNRTEAH